MKVLLSYSTNSGSTYLVGKIIKETLERENYKVTLKQASDTVEADITEADLVILGSPSWLVEGKQGMPHENTLKLLKTLNTGNMKDKNFVVYGCGDSSYTFFCGAVDHIEAHLLKVGGIKIMPPLKIDGFYFNLDATQEQAYAWTQVLTQNL